MNQIPGEQRERRPLLWIILSVASFLGFLAGWLAKQSVKQVGGTARDAGLVPCADDTTPQSKVVSSTDERQGTAMGHLEMIQRGLGIAAGIVGIIYVVGFVIVNFSLGWHYGFFTPDLLRVRYLSSGLFYSLYVIFIVVYIYLSIWIADHSMTMANRKFFQAIWLVGAFAFLLVLGFFFFGAVAPAPLLMSADVRDAYSWWEPISIVPYSDTFRMGESFVGVGYTYGDFALTCSFYIIASVFAYSLGVWEIYRFVHRSSSNVLKRKFRPMSALVSVVALPILLALYSILLYPNLYIAVGGGSSLTVQLLVKPDQVDQAARYQLSWVSPSQTALVQILDRTSAAYVVDSGFPGFQAIQLPSEVVVGVVYYPVGTATLSNAYWVKGWEAFQEEKFFAALEFYQRALDVNQWNAWAFWAQGLAYEALGKRTEAISAYSNAVRLGPSALNGQGRLARLYLESGQLDKAHEWYQRCLETAETVNPTHVDAVYRGLGETSLARLDLESAIRYLERAVQVDPEDEFNLRLLADAYAADATRFLLQGDFQSAVARYHSALRVQPDDFRLQEDQAMAYLASGDPNKALSKIEELVKNWPFDARAHLDNAIALSKFGWADLAVAEFEKATGLDPGLTESVRSFAQLSPTDPQDVTGFNRRGVMRAQVGDWFGALDDFDRALQLDTEVSWVYVNRALVYDHFDLHHLAIADFDSAIKLLGTNPLAAVPLVGRGNVYYELGILSSAAKDYESASQSMRDLSWPHLKLAWVYGHQNLDDDMLAELEQALSLLTLPVSVQNLVTSHQLVDPYRLDAAGIYAQESSLLQWKDRFDEAIRYMEKAIELDPNERDYYSDLGSLYENVGKLDEAQATYETALSKWPDLPIFHHALGLLLAKRANWGEAEEQYKLTTQIHPNFAPAYYELGNLYKEAEKVNEAIEYYEICVKTNYSHRWAEDCQKALEKLKD